MPPDTAASVMGQALGYLGLIVTALGGVVAIFRSLRRGPREDKKLEADIQDTVTAMAERWLRTADDRLKAAEARAESAEKKATEIAEEFRMYQTSKEKEHREMLDHLLAVHDWIDAGAPPPPPVKPYWLVKRKFR